MASPGEPVLWSLYVYAPNQGAPIFFIIAYGFSAIFHMWQCVRYQAWKLMWLHSVCAVSFTLGYALRKWGAHNYLYLPTDKTPLMVFVLSQVFIYICPPLLELSNYHVLGRIFSYIPYCAPLPASRVLATFGGLMAVVEALNAVGVALVANPSGSAQGLGTRLTLAALAIQVVVIVIFVAMAALFHRRFARAGLLRRSARGVRAVLLVLYASLMLLNSWLWNVWHPGRFLPRDHHVYLAEDGTEVTGDIHEDSRPLLAKTAHVLTFGLLFRNKKEGAHRMQELGEYPPGSSHYTA
ncbi:hypothetical protein CHGG_09268 [Chaetomium globosum CBS 148.51]|uniref:RTA1 domain protein n=1 Tax=Chaetomium globosum (strain ATCC 6205 / CBS 148.51 / DSM 1962 / NBRC 6347 / NRRL 1970) TaxID=306901 RepID=Q2GRY6_CHAGB|nr:uncharacterized protein CHGG_09268 [Chaetomium globosum CBS 148.51]EAQ85254.1 hypothetical protein CHGG_09268 [Chaetomium globosum CBS 148.51]